MAVAFPSLAPAREDSLNSRLNWLRAGVLGANDGIVSIAGLVFGVAGATSDQLSLLVAGLAGVVAGALSMAGGEYVSVSSQRDTELAALAEQRRAASSDPALVANQLRAYYLAQGLEPDLADRVATELTAGGGGLDHHARTTIGLDADTPVSPWAAARASLLAFVAGAVIPLVAMVFSPYSLRLPVTVVAVWLALLLTGLVSSRLGGSRPGRPMLRNLVVGTLAMGLTYLMGTLAGGLLA
ncbi:MAG: VIT family protein [Propionicimonas sp.]|nr:VIT family protein [Propionicimonas sp.]